MGAFGGLSMLSKTEPLMLLRAVKENWGGVFDALRLKEIIEKWSVVALDSNETRRAQLAASRLVFAAMVKSTEFQLQAARLDVAACRPVAPTVSIQSMNNLTLEDALALLDRPAPPAEVPSAQLGNTGDGAGVTEKSPNSLSDIGDKSVCGHVDF